MSEVETLIRHDRDLTQLNQRVETLERMFAELLEAGEEETNEPDKEENAPKEGGFTPKTD